jgi:hypothetical protein
MQTLAHFAGIGAFLLRFERGSRFERGRTQPSLQYVETRDLRSQIVTSSYWREDESKIGIGGMPRGSAPPTPPDMRVRIRRFGGLSYRSTVKRGIPSESK